MDLDLDMWKKVNPNKLFEHLDFFLISLPLVHMIHKVGIDPSFKTDHSLPWIGIYENKSERGPGFWKLNVSLLQDPEYIKLIEECIKQEIETNHSTYALKWEMIKLMVRGKTIQYSACKKKDLDVRFKALEKKGKKILKAAFLKLRMKII